MRWGRTVGVALLVGALGAPAAAATTTGLPRPGDAALSALRLACDAQWIDPACRAAAYPDPGYRAVREPSAGAPLRPRIGILHDHSSYSDGDPNQRPADYFRAARDGHNTADDGSDTGVAVDFLIASEHSENEKLPVTTAEACLDPTAALACVHLLDGDHHRKWEAALDQAVAASDRTNGTYTGFTGMRGFEFTNDYANHLGVYLSRNVRNAKADGSYVTTEAFWSWLRTPADRGGGADAVVVFNHPGGNPALTPFDGELPTGDLLQATLGRANWDGYAYVPAADEQVSGIEVNRGDDLLWYIRALRNGWHLGPIAAEDEHEREWSSSDEGKTVVLTRGRSPRDYYFALRSNRSMAFGPDVVGGLPGHPATYPSVAFWADGSSVEAPGASPLGARLRGGTHTLELAAGGLAPGSRAVLVSRAGGTPTSLGTAGPDGTVRASRTVAAPAAGEDWWFVVICGADATRCGADERYDIVTAPIWVRAG